MNRRRHRRPAFAVLLLVAVYCATWLLHDTVFLKPDPFFRPTPGALLDHRTADHFERSAPSHSGEACRECAEHYCPFCSGFTGGPPGLSLPLPSDESDRFQLPPSRLDGSRSEIIPSVRAPPVSPTIAG